MISPEMIASLPDWTIEDVRLHAAYSSYDYRSGWNAAWGLPKDTELVTKLGSAMLFSISKEKQNEACDLLAKLEQSRIGNRRSEGYGPCRSIVFEGWLWAFEYLRDV